MLLNENISRVIFIEFLYPAAGHEHCFCCVVNNAKCGCHLSTVKIYLDIEPDMLLFDLFE